MSLEHAPQRAGQRGDAPTQDPEALLDKHQTSALIGIKPKTLEVWRQNGSGPSFIRISSTCVRYRRGDVLDWIRSRRVAAAV